MERIIVLYGAANRGKTTTLKILMGLLTLVSESYDVWQETDDAWGRFVVNDRKVSICTSGDNEYVVKDNIKNYKDCDIFVSASRTKGGSVNEIEKFAEKKKVEIDWVEKVDDEGKNKLAAADLFRKVLDLVYPAEY